MTTKTLFRAMALIAAAGGAIAFALPYLRSEVEAPAKRRRSTRRTSASASTAPAKAAAEKARGTRARRSGNGGSPSHH